MLAIIQRLTGEEGEPASFTVRRMLPSFTRTGTKAKQPFTSQSEKDNLSPRSTMQKITRRTRQSAQDLPDTRPLVRIDLQAAHSCFHTGLCLIGQKCVVGKANRFFFIPAFSYPLCVSVCFPLCMCVFVWVGAVAHT